MAQNYPNPFNPTTIIEFNIPQTTNVTLKIFNILGEKVATLVSDRLTAGSYNYEWDASKMASGVYMYRLSVGSLSGQAEEFVETRKMVLMR
ncbi:MAG: T9SS type A sorting domain-containing protein [Candidatus Sifarchaeia archaeon]